MGCCITLHQLTQVGAHPGVLAKPTTQTSPGPQQPCWLCGWADPTLLTGQETWPSAFSGFDSWEMVVPRGEPGSAEVLGEPHPSAGQRSPKAAGAAGPERGGVGGQQAGIQWGEGAGETQEPAFDLVGLGSIFFAPNFGIGQEAPRNSRHPSMAQMMEAVMRTSGASAVLLVAAVWPRP